MSMANVQNEFGGIEDLINHLMEVKDRQIDGRYDDRHAARVTSWINKVDKLKSNTEDAEKWRLFKLILKEVRE